MNYRSLIHDVKFIAVAAFLLTIVVPLSSQENVFVSQSFENLEWPEFVDKAENEFNVRFFYNKEELSNVKISFLSDSVTLDSLLGSILPKHNLFTSFDNNGNIFITKETLVMTKLPGDFFTYNNPMSEEEDVDSVESAFLKTTKSYVAKTIVVGDKKSGINKRYAKISGYATNKKTGEHILGATILEESTGKGTVTDINGFYSLQLKRGEHLLTVRSVNLKEKQIKINLLSDGTLDLLLEDKVLLLPDVVINAEIDNRVKGTQMGLEKIEAKSVKRIPVVFGEKDILKVAMLLPGVQSVGEGSSGFNVRGSPADQNIFYINNVFSDLICWKDQCSHSRAVDYLIFGIKIVIK
jgi:hypothetical protein